MKNFRKFLAVFLSIAMVMCSSLPSVASENYDATNETSETTKSKIEEQLKNDLGEERANEILNGESREEESETTVGDEPEEESVGASTASPEEETESTDSVETSEEGSHSSPVQGESESTEEENESTDSVETSEEGSHSSPVQGESESAEEENESTYSVETSEEGSQSSPVQGESESAEEENESTDSVETSEEGSHSSPVQGESESAEEENEPTDSVETSEEGSHSSPVQGESETVEESESIAATSNDKLLNLDPLGARPWMYFWVTDGDTIHYSSPDYFERPNDAIAVADEEPLDVVYRKVGLNVADIKTAKFEDAIVALTCDRFFAEFSELDNIENIENLNTANVQNMGYMFQNCESLTSLDLTSFDTSNVTSMSGLFIDCMGLKSLDISKFDTSNVQSMENMFYYCAKLDAVDLSNFDTSKVSTMMNMFYHCEELEELDLSSFDTSNVTNMGFMFYECKNLVKIIVSTKFVTTNVTDSDYMFDGCSAIKGGDGIGTRYIDSHIDKEYARIDKEYMPGYFTAATWMYYWTTSNGDLDETLTIHYASPYYENIPSTAKGINESFNIIYDSSLDRGKIKKATFEDEIEAVTCNVLFLQFTKLEVIENISKLKTGDVTSMESMFFSCEALTKIDLGGLDTFNVRNMAFMFYGCTSINKIEFNSDIKFVTSNVENMFAMFSGCSSLTYLDLRRFDTSKVTTMGMMFLECSLLKTIIVVSDSFDTSRVLESEQMFAGCTSLEGIAGTIYDNSHTDMYYARIDEGSSYPGYFSPVPYGPWMYWYLTDSSDGKAIHYTSTETENYTAASIKGSISETYVINYGTELNKSEVKLAVFDNVIVAETCGNLFYEFTNLEKIENIDNLKTNKVTNMLNMFYRCLKLESIDLKHMNTSIVTRMDGMFGYCSSLTALDLSDFDTSQVKFMAFMFDGCSNLKDLNISTLKTENILSMNLMFSECKSLTYLDLSSFNNENVEQMVQMFYDCESLETIVVSGGFVPSSSNNMSMFEGCSSLVGANGTEYDSTKVNFEYACIDDSTHKGYLSEAPWLYWYLDDNGKTIHYTSEKAEDRVGMTRIDQIVYRGLSDADRAKITKAVIDDSFNPPTCALLFADFRGLESIEGLANLKTDNVTDMQYMFCNCNQLSSLNFDNSSFVTDDVKNMDYMFRGCEKIERLDLSLLNTENVKSMEAMFSGCFYLKSLDLTFKFNTSNVENMEQMFADCSSLVDLDLANFNTINVKNMKHMFANCSSLERIYAANSFEITLADENNEMFLGCTKLVGSSGTTYDPNHTDKEYAHIDGGSTNPGYFYTNNWMWWRLEGNVLHLYGSEPTTAYGGVISGSSGVSYGVFPRTEVEEVVFENEVTARAGVSMFGNFQKLKKIYGIKNLNTSLVKDMANMFTGCMVLEEVDLSYFDTSRVTRMSSMFANCEKLTKLNLEKFDTSKVTDMESMFSGCSELTELDLTAFNTENVVNMTALFYGNSKLESLDLSSFDTSKVEYMGRMFANCGNLKTIVASVKFETYEVEDSSRMFEGCTSLKGGEGTAFDSNNLYLLYARIDGGTSEPGYFTGIPWLWWEVKNNGRELHLYGSKPGTGNAKGISSGSKVTYEGLKKSNVTKVVVEENIIAATCVELFSDFVNLVEIEKLDQLETGFAHSMQQMFYNCKKLESIDMSNFYTTDMINMSEAFSGCETLTYIDLTKNFTTSRVEYMDRMFEGCKNLTLLDLSEFDTKHVKTMKLMFKDCSALKTIIASKDFVTYSTGDDGQAMFLGCTALVGGNGTKFDANHTNKEYARIDEGPNSTSPGYFTLTGTVVVLDSVSLNTAPTTTNYTVGQTLNPAGLKLNLHYSNGTTNVTGYDSTTAKEFSFSPSLSTRLTTAHTYVTVIYDGKTTSFAIRVTQGGGVNPKPSTNTGGSSSGSSGGGGGGGPTIAEDVPGITYLNATSAIAGVFASSSSNWSYDPVDNSWQLNSIDANGNVVRAINGLYALTRVRTHIVNGVPIETIVPSVYCLNANAKMVTGWVKTLDGKWFFFENKKNADEGKMVTGWKQIQGAWYYFGEDGAMYINTVTPDGYRIGADGKLIV